MHLLLYFFISGKQTKVSLMGFSQNQSNIPEGSHSGWGVEDDLGPIDPKHEPVKWVVTAIADVHSNLTCQVKKTGEQAAKERGCCWL